MTWHILLITVLAIGVGLGGCVGHLSIEADDDTGADDASSDDDDDDDDTGDDDTGDDDTGDDDTGDDDTSSDDDDDCPWDGSYSGATILYFPYWDEECATEATIEACDVDGLIDCSQGWDSYQMIFFGSVEPSGEAAGWVIGDVGDMGDVDTEWSGEVAPDGLSGWFHQDLPWESVEGEFRLGLL